VNANVVLFWQENLPSLWRDTYVNSIIHQTYLVHLRLGAFEYICDVYSDLEARGEVAYDQSLQHRVVAAFGFSGARTSERTPSSRRIDPDEHLAIAEHDNGHLIAHCIGGSGINVNVFSQDRSLNRGRSAQGKIYRQMETYCYEQPGTFCFSRPLYNDASNVPRWLEFGVLKDDKTLWVVVFDN
jgi:hypothetical protein